jgi:hypothetical protein
MTGRCRSWSTQKVISCLTPRDSMTLVPLLPSGSYGIASTVFRALPCAPLAGDTYASRLETRAV